MASEPSGVEGARKGMKAVDRETVKELPLSVIVVDDSLQVRRKLNPAAVKAYRTAYKYGRALPPLRVARVNKGALKLVDGWHRLEALKSLGVARTAVEVVETTAHGAKWEAARANLQHGVPLKPAEYRNVFRVYVSTRQHITGKGRYKSYRDIAQEIGGTRAYTTIRNWMLKDFPKVAQKMGGLEVGGFDPERRAPHPDDELLATGLEGAANAAAAARGITDAARRGRLVQELREALETAERAGPYDLPDEDF
jgi:hypothetical protein